MNKFLTNLKTQTEENPMVALGVVAGFTTAAVKFIDVVSKAQERNAYAKNARTRAKKSKK